MAAAAAPPMASAAAPPTLSSLLKPPFPGLEGRAARRGEKRSLGICPGNGPLGVGPSVTAVVSFSAGSPVGGSQWQRGRQQDRRLAVTENFAAVATRHGAD